MLTATDKLNYLKAVDAFHVVSVEDLSSLSDEVANRRYKAGEHIFNQGDRDETLYIITKGRVAIELEEAHKTPVRVAELGPGEYFGEMALFDGKPRSATALAIADTNLMCVGRDTFLKLGTREPRILVEVIRVLSERLRETDSSLRAK